MFTVRLNYLWGGPMTLRIFAESTMEAARDEWMAGWNRYLSSVGLAGPRTWDGFKKLYGAEIVSV